MPVTYDIDTASSLIRTRCAGVVTLDDVMGHFESLINDPACPPCLNVLLDLGELSTPPEIHQLRAVSDEIGRIRAVVKFNALAVVASNDLVFGLSRMFEVFAKHFFRVTHVFRACDAAEQWLGTYRLPPAS